jgi:8-oxo-dGTP pyrophosphatase MutT (NUDIX family)
MYETEWFENVSARLSGITPVLSPNTDRKPAAVALILRQDDDRQELLFIERAHHPDDPWAGNIGFPGGRRDPVDLSLRHTAERETMEEVGIDLASARYLGRLSDVMGANLPVRVSCFVYGLHSPVQPVLSDEVHDSFWFGLHQLTHPRRQVTAQVRFGGRLLEAPAIDLGLPGKMVLWGLTYRLVSQFKEIMASGKELILPYELPL